MGKGTIGVLVAGLAMTAGALSAEAQGIDVTITGPLAIYDDQNEMSITATVSNYPAPPATYFYNIRVKHNGVQKHNSSNHTASGASLTYNGVCNMATWGLAPGHTIEIIAKVWTSSQNYKIRSSFYTVQEGEGGGGQTYAPAKVEGVQLYLPGEEALAFLRREDAGVNA